MCLAFFCIYLPDDRAAVLTGKSDALLTAPRTHKYVELFSVCNTPSIYFCVFI